MAGVRMRVRLRVELGRRGEHDDVERGLFDGDAEEQAWWRDTAMPPRGTYVHEHGHILADVEHLLLQDQVRVREGEVVVTSTVRLEGHPLHGLAEPLRRLPVAGPHAHRFTNLLVKQYHEVVDIFSDPKLRREFAHAIRHPQLLTPRMQRSLLFLVLLSSLWVWVVGLTLVALAAPRLAVGWNLAFTNYFAALGTNLFLPIPVEPLVLASLGSLGVPLSVGSSAAGKAVGAWIIFTLGPWLRRGVQRLEARSALTRRVMAQAQRFARRYGYVALGAMLAVPFSPFDIVPVYLFSTMGLRLGPFLAAVFVGFAARLLAVVLLGDLLFGLA